MLKHAPRGPERAATAALVVIALAAACGTGGDGKRGGSAAAPADQLSDEALAARALAQTRLEKTELKLGFIKLTDCAPLVIAKEMGFFEEEGLNVTLEAQANWKILLDRVLSGELDGAHMLAGQPLGATIGIGTKADVVTAFSMDLNGNGITVSNAIWKRMQEVDPALRAERPPHPISAKALATVVKELKAKGTPLQLGMVFPVSTHNYELRYWLAAAGIHPGYYTPEDTRGVKDADVLISVTPPPQMPATMEAGTISGYCVGEPWNQQAVMKGIGVAVTTDYDIWKNNPEKVFGVTRGWADGNQHTHVAVVKALIRAGRWLDESTEHRKQAAQILSRREYVGAEYEVIANSMTGTFLSQASDRRELPDFNVFYRHNATYPYYSDAIWFLTQMRRWGQIDEARPDAWYHETAKKVYLPSVYLTAARALLEEGKLEKDEVPWDTDGYRPPTAEFIDGIEYDGRHPVEYLSRLQIGYKDAQVAVTPGAGAPQP
jgi:nitrate/nitrite transport system substrate-binding protein